MSERPAPAPGLLVDTARAQLDHCDPRVVSFRSRDEGWVGDACGHVFHTTDGGRSFRAVPHDGKSLAFMEYDPDFRGKNMPMEKGHVEVIEWLSDRDAVAFGYCEANVLLTSDGGATWRRSPAKIPECTWIAAAAHAGDSIWACTSRAIYRSRDRGASFTPVRRTPFTDEDNCAAISFLDDRQGWAGGHKGSLFETRDGGDSWRRLKLPKEAVGRVGGVVRLSPTEAWVAIYDELSPRRYSPPRYRAFHTTSSGTEWHHGPAPLDVAGRFHESSRWGNGAVFLRDARLQFHLGDQLVRDTPLVEQRKPALEAVRGREALAPGHVSAWTDHAVVESFDDGRSWSTIVRVAAGRLGRAVHADGTIIVELTDGRLFHGSSKLEASKQPEFDRFRMALVEAHRRGEPAPPGPLACLATAPSGRIEFRYGYYGCDGGDQWEGELVWADKTTAFRWKGLPALALTADERARALRGIAEAVERPDDGRHGCTSGIFVDLTWTCGTARQLRVAFQEDDCPFSDSPTPAGPVHRVREILVQLLKRAEKTGQRGGGAARRNE